MSRGRHTEVKERLFEPYFVTGEHVGRIPNRAAIDAASCDGDFYALPEPRSQAVVNRRLVDYAVWLRVGPVSRGRNSVSCSPRSTVNQHGSPPV